MTAIPIYRHVSVHLHVVAYVYPRSLSNLALVINKLASFAEEGKQDFVPFRNSKLTYILPLPCFLCYI